MPDLSKMKNFCAMPFHHVMVGTNGDYNVCCQHKMKPDMNINHHTVEQWRDSEYLNQVREAFLSDQRHPGCDKCWNQEDQGFISLRQRTAKEYKILRIDLDKMALTNAEVNLTNLCNLKCLMCNENESSSILAENTQLGINVIDQKNIKWSDQGYQNLQNVLMQNPKLVSIRGGEPLYIKPLLELIENIPEHSAKTMALHISTNATMWNQRWHDALTKFRLVRFMFSVDAVKDLYEYIRFPASWNTVQHNIENMRALPNAQSLVHCVVQNLNISSLGDLIAWCRDQSLWLDLDMLHWPDYLKISNLPDQQRSLALSHLKDIKTNQIESHLIETIENCIKLLESAGFDPAEWDRFVKNVGMRDQLRGNDFKKFIKINLEQ